MKEFNIPGLDCQRGITMTGGTVSGYCTVLSMFCKDAENRLPLVKTAPETDTLPMFIICVHALKSACNSIGSANVSALAAELEAAGRTGNETLIQEKLPFFAEQLTELIMNIKTALEKNSALETGNEKNTGTATNNFTTLIFNRLKELSAALEAQKASDISRILKELKEISGQNPMDSSVKEALEQISDEVMMAEYDNAVIIAEKLIPAFRECNGV